MSIMARVINLEQPTTKKAAYDRFTGRSCLIQAQQRHWVR